MNKRVMGLLGVTRSFGDNSIKEFVIAEPFISSVQVTSECKFVVMGCDGVFDVLSDEEVCVIVKKCIHQNLVQECAHHIVDEALRRDSRDNISAIVIGLCPVCSKQTTSFASLASFASFASFASLASFAPFASTTSKTHSMTRTAQCTAWPRSRRASRAPAPSRRTFRPESECTSCDNR